MVLSKLTQEERGTAMHFETVELLSGQTAFVPRTPCGCGALMKALLGKLPWHFRPALYKGRHERLWVALAPTEGTVENARKTLEEAADKVAESALYVGRVTQDLQDAVTIYHSLNFYKEDLTKME